MPNSRLVSLAMQTFALAAVLASAIWVGVVGWHDLDLYVAVLGAVPILLALPGFVLTLMDKRAGVITLIAAILVMGWAALQSTNVGIYFFPSGAVLALAGMASLADRRRRPLA